MKFLDKNIIGMSYDEEISLAKSVMSTLQLRYIDEEFQEFLTTLFFKKARWGSPLDTNGLDFILQKYDFYKIEFPVIEEDGSYIGSSEVKKFVKSGNFDKEGFSFCIAQQVSFAWYEMWCQNESFQRCAGIFSIFPEFGKSDPKDIKTDAQILEKLRNKIRPEFDQEVCRVMSEYSISKDEAITWVSDYIPNPDSDDFGFD